jgi:hypothetical protein
MVGSHHIGHGGIFVQRSPLRGSFHEVRRRHVSEQLAQRAPLLADHPGLGSRPTQQHEAQGLRPQVVGQPLPSPDEHQR